MKRMGSISVSASVIVVVVVLLLGCFVEVQSDTKKYPAQHNATISSITSIPMDENPCRPQRQRWIRETYRQPELPVFGVEDIDARVSDHADRNYRPTQKDTKKSSFVSSSSASIKSSKSSKSSKKSTKRDGSVMFTSQPSSHPTILPTIGTKPALPTTSAIPTFMPSSLPTPTDPFTTRRPTRKPTPQPTPLTGITIAPTAEFDFLIEAPTYSLLYFFDDTTGDISTTDEEFVQLGEVTRLFLDDYFDEKYGATIIISFSKVLTRVVGFSSISLPIQTFFFTKVVFSENSIFYPPRSEVEREIEKAFSTFGANFEYLMAVRGLPTSNTFQSVSSVSWGGYGGG